MRWYSLWSVGRLVAEWWLGLLDALSRMQVQGAVSGCKKVTGRARERWGKLLLAQTVVSIAGLGGLSNGCGL